MAKRSRGGANKAPQVKQPEATDISGSHENAEVIEETVDPQIDVLSQSLEDDFLPEDIKEESLQNAETPPEPHKTEVKAVPRKLQKFI